MTATSPSVRRPGHLHATRTGADGTSRPTRIVLAVLTVAGLVAMHGLSWSHDTGCHPGTASVAGAAGAVSFSAQQAHGHDAPAGDAARVSGSRGVGLGALATVATAFTSATAPTVLTQGVPEQGRGPMLMCVAVLTGLAALALLLAAAYRLRGHVDCCPRTRSMPGARRGRAPPLPYLSPRLPVLCVSRT